MVRAACYCATGAGLHWLEMYAGHPTWGRKSSRFQIALLAANTAWQRNWSTTLGVATMPFSVISGAGSCESAADPMLRPSAVGVTL